MQALIKMNIRTKMLVYILAPAIIIFIVSIAYINIKNRKLALVEANKLCYETTLKNANTIEKSLSEDMAVIRTLALAFTTFNQMEEKQWKDLFLRMIYKTFEKNTQFDEFSFSLELKYFDENRASDTGRYFLHFRRNGNEIPFFGMDVNLDKFSEVYLNAKSISKDMIWKPWLNNKNKFITNISSPIYVNNQFAGYVVGDFYIDRFKSIIDKIKPYAHTTAMLISNEGVIVAHKDTSIIGKSILGYDTTLENQLSLSQKIKEGASGIYNATDSIENNVIVTTVPIQIGEHTNPWALTLIIPVNEVLKEANKTQSTSLIAAFIGILLLSITIYFTSKNISFALERTTEAMKTIAQGNIKSVKKLDIARGDEIEEMANSVSSVANKLRNMINKINNSAKQIASSSKKADNNSHSLSKNAGEQAASLEEISAAMEQATANIQNNANNAIETEEISKTAFDGINKISDSTNETMRSIQNISEKITIITDIAFQTNILALNAAVEAARAGEHGKGFAVVAAEVRKLAEHSKNAAKEIIELTNNSVQATKNTVQLIKGILPDIERTSMLIKEISTASSEQQNGTNMVNQSIQQLNSVTQQNSESAEMLAENSKLLHAQAEDLKDLIAYFKI